MVKNIHVLIADDNKGFTTVLCDYLSMFPDLKIVGVACNGLETIEMLQKCKPDILLLDIVMPDMDGIEILLCINELLTFKPVVFILSALANGDVINRCFTLGISDYFMKPLNLKSIVSKIRTSFQNGPAKKKTKNLISNSYAMPMDFEEKITSFLLLSGIPANILGFKFARDIIGLYVGQNCEGNLSKLYSVVAHHYNTTPVRVIKSIEYAIKVAWDRNSYSPKNEIMKLLLEKNHLRPNNIQFVRELSVRIARENGIFLS